MIPFGTRSLVGRYGRRCRCKCDLSFSGARQGEGATVGADVSLLVHQARHQDYGASLIKAGVDSCLGADAATGFVCLIEPLRHNSMLALRTEKPLFFLFHAFDPDSHIMLIHVFY